MAESLSYRAQIDEKRMNRLRQLEKELPLVCTDFFRSVAWGLCTWACASAIMRITARTRLFSAAIICPLPIRILRKKKPFAIKRPAIQRRKAGKERLSGGIFDVKFPKSLAK